MKKSIVTNTIFNTGYRILNVFFPLITSVYVSRIIGSDGVGRIAYAQNILSYFLIFASVGIPVYGIKEISRKAYNKNECNRSFTELFIINSITTTICIIIYVFLVISVPNFYSDINLFWASGISLFLNYFNIDWFYSGIEEYVYITVRSTIIKLCAIISIFLFVRDRADVVNYAIVFAIGLSANYLFNIINARKKISLCFTNINIRRHIKPVTILVLTILAADLYNQIDITMMGNICTKSEIGYYAYSIKVIRIVISITAAISATMLPRLSRYYSEKKYNEFQNFANKVLNIEILLIMPCVVGVVFCAENIITVLYGLEFKNAIPLIKILSPIIFIISVSYLCGSITLTAINREKYLLYATIAGAITNITLNMILIPRFHGTGAAIASVIAEFVVLVLHIIFSHKYVHYNFISWENAKAVVNVLFLIIPLMLLQHFVKKPIINLLLSIICGICIYFPIIYFQMRKIKEVKR